MKVDDEQEKSTVDWFGSHLTFLFKEYMERRLQNELLDEMQIQRKLQRTI